MDHATAFPHSAGLRAQRFQTARRLRREKAWQVARTAAALLKAQYHAARVVAFGSLVDPERFHPWSDVDLGVWGLPPEDYFEAVARVLDVGGEIKVDLIQAERCKPFLAEALSHGVDL